MIQKLLHYDVTHKKSATPNQKIVFSMQTRRLAYLFEPLNSSLAQSAEELWRLGHSMSNHPMTYTSPSSILMKLGMYIGPIEICRNSKCQLDWPIGYRVVAF